MNQMFTIAKKELKGYFLSPVALIFLGTFLLGVLLSFFWVDTFFKRNIADVRPLFHWLPLLLILLVSALTMRLWSEEQRMGTLEILLTLPVKIYKLVLGKFLAGLALVAIALALTLSLPITVSMLGDLDWGPVFGGYLGALLVAAAYLAIGLCISSSTNNPIVALLLTMLSGSVLYLIGSDAIAGFAGNRGAEVLRALGIGSRFESIQRGVIDLRDLLYYGSLCLGFLFLNTVILEAKKWSTGSETRPRRSSAKIAVVLVLANLLVLNVGFAAVRGARLDLTERDEYSISPATKKLLAGLEAPLVIRGYFSSKTHKLLAPLVPRIRDMIEEYGAVGGSKVVAEFIDPYANPAAEKEANEDYGIKSIPFQFADRHESAVVNSYFHVLIKYGDKYETLGFDNLIETKVTGMESIEVKLRNLEYDFTRTIKKVVYGFQPLESLFARISGKVVLTAYVTPKSLPKNLQEVPARLQKVAQEIAQRSSNKFEFKTVDPSGAESEQLRLKLFKENGFKPMPVSLFSEDYFYLHLLLSAGDKTERIFPAPEMAEADLRTEITTALKRMAPGFLKTVGLLVTKTEQPPPNPMMGRRPPPQGPTYRQLEEQLGEEYTVKNVELKDGRVPGDVDMLLVFGPEDLEQKQQFAIDQFLMRGGPVVICTGAYALDLSGRGELAVKKVTSKLEPMLKQWGITIEPELVLDPQNEAFPMPVQRNVMGMTIREIQLLNYPFWVDVRSSGMTEDNLMVSGLPSLTLQWSSPLKLEKKEGLEQTVLLRSSNKSWTQDTASVQPDFVKYPQKGFGPPEKAETKARPLAVALTGSFTSAFKGQPSPLLKGETDEASKGEQKGKKSENTGVIEKSPASGRLVVVASPNFLRDDVLGISRHSGSDRFRNNLQFVQNMVDWSVADTDLLSIRSRGTYARTLEPLEDAKMTTYEVTNYVVMLGALFLIVGLAYIRRRNLQPITLVSQKKKQQPVEA